MKYCKVKGCRFSKMHVTSRHICGNCGKKGHGIMECGNKLKYNSLKKFYKEIVMFTDICRQMTCKDKNYHTSEGHFCSVCKKGFHIDTECKHIMVENKNQYISFYNQSVKDKLKFVLPNRNNWKIDLDCISIIENILKQDYIKNFESRVMNCFYKKSYQGYSLDHLFEIIREHIDENSRNIYFEFDGGMGCGIFIKLDTYILPLQAFFLHSDCQGQYGNCENTNHLPFLENFLRGYDLKDIKSFV